MAVQLNAHLATQIRQQLGEQDHLSAGHDELPQLPFLLAGKLLGELHEVWLAAACREYIKAL